VVVKTTPVRFFGSRSGQPGSGLAGLQRRRLQCRGGRHAGPGQGRQPGVPWPRALGLGRASPRLIDERRRAAYGTCSESSSKQKKTVTRHKAGKRACPSPAPCITPAAAAVKPPPAAARPPHWRVASNWRPSPPCGSRPSNDLPGLSLSPSFAVLLLQPKPMHLIAISWRT
jgi:hypothetical protein